MFGKKRKRQGAKPLGKGDAHILDLAVDQHISRAVLLNVRDEREKQKNDNERDENPRLWQLTAVREFLHKMLQMKPSRKIQFRLRGRMYAESWF